MGDGGIHLVLFVANDGPRSIIAIENLRQSLADFPDKAFDLEIVNVYEEVARALRDRVIVTPTLLAPVSRRRLVGDLSETGYLLYFLQGLPPAPKSNLRRLT